MCILGCSSLAVKISFFSFGSHVIQHCLPLCLHIDYFVFQIYSCTHDGDVCLMDVEKEIFNAIYLCDYPAFSLCQAPDNATCLYFGEGNGQLKAFDERVGKVSSKWLLHHDSICSIDINPENPNMLATSSLDSTACLWDLRNMKLLKPESLKVVKHEHSVHSAYFSPSGSFLATTRFYFSHSLFNLHIVHLWDVICQSIISGWMYLSTTLLLECHSNGHVVYDSFSVCFLW